MTLPTRPVALLFDFDGVVVLSDHIRTDGFRAVFADEPEESVERLIAYHQANGGLSRYQKIRWYFETVKGRTVSDALVAELAGRFKAIMLERMSDPSILIPATIDFIKSQRHLRPLHLLSASDGEELRHLCRNLGVDSLFDSIEGSPTPKIALTRALVARHGYPPERLILIGDSINDRDAAAANGIAFTGYNNPMLRPVADYYIDDLPTFAARLDPP